MIGSFITRGLVLILGYAYPAYECFKTIEKNKPDIQQLVFWCQYWILVAGLTVCERISDVVIGWVPMYSEAKLAFFIYLWYPKTKGTKYVYDSFFRPYVAKHEPEIDRSLLELRTRAGDMAILYWQKAASYGQTRIFEILQYFASHSSPPRASQPQQQGTRVVKSTDTSNIGSTATTQKPRDKQQPSSSPTTSSTSSSSDEEMEEVGPSVTSKPAPTPTSSNEQKTTQALTVVKRSKTTNPTEDQVMQIDSAENAKDQPPPPPPQETILEDTKRVTTRARFRKRTVTTR